jgi:MFS family permease
LTSSNRGRGTGIFQWLLTFGIVAAALIGIYYSYRVQAVAATASGDAIFQVKDQAWRHIFWISLPPGILFMIGSLFVGESPRWLYRKGRSQQALASLQRTRGVAKAEVEFAEMQAVSEHHEAREGGADSLLRRKYVIPFLLACVILFCNTATGVNSIIGYNTSILLQSGLSDLVSHWGYVLFTTVNFLMTIVGMLLVDRKGRKFLLIVGSTGLMLSLIVIGSLFWRAERSDRECRAAVQSMVGRQQDLTLNFNPKEAARALSASGYTGVGSIADHASLAVIYSYGGFTGETTYVRSDNAGATQIRITREGSVPSNAVEAFFKNPFANLKAAQTAPLKIERARIGRVPSARHGSMVALALFSFIAFFAVGPGVCVWLALSELMPTRIRSVGMSIALVINQLVSTTLAVVFLPVASRYGYSMMFFLFAGFTVIYLVTATFFLPETKGKTLEEIEIHFEGSAIRE